MLFALAARPVAGFERTEAREACAHSNPRREPYFGDLHVHTRLSLDASTQGTRLGPADAYRFARGEALGIQPYDRAGRALRQLRLERPLDFAAVTDHAELLGEAHICKTPDLPGYDSIVCRIYRRWPRVAFFWMNWKVSSGSPPERFGFCGEAGAGCLDAARAPWREIQQAAEAAYDRSAACRFTSFVGYEWTGAAGAGNNLHRNVIFRTSVVPELPASFIETPEPELLWRRLRQECLEAGRGCDALVIPHNSNLSGGRMFQIPEDPSRARDHARARAEFERLVEVMQHKGDSECMPGLGSEDELCGFEKLAMSNFQGRYVRWLAEPPVARQFVRNVLREGLEWERRIGINPFQFGLIASTDTHLAAPGAVEESARYPGHGGAGTPAREGLPVGFPDAIDFNPGGLAVLWAEENSRDALFTAMRRREAYGTSGPRMVVRFFGAWQLPSDLCTRGDLVAEGYANGVPMGGELGAPPVPSHEAMQRPAAPIFAVSALQDPGPAGRPGTPLERIQIVKGWGAGTRTHERVYDVARAARIADRSDAESCGKLPHGAASLCAVWRDPDFDPEQSAFYYARVLERPTCRWSARLCEDRGVRCGQSDTIGPGLESCCDAAVPHWIRERAWTSPIWYAPEGATQTTVPTQSGAR